jgi:N-acetylglutamate synthase-like GNAT family acetyltransferase
MRHARAEDLDRVDALLDELRLIDGLTEKTRGVFYVRSKAFLHFHEHEGEILCDVRLDLSAADFDRRVLTTKATQRALVRDVRTALGP